MNTKRNNKTRGKAINKKWFLQAYVQKILISIGLVFVVLTAVWISIIIYLASIVSEMNKSSKEYMDKAIPAISSDWNAKALEERASGEFKNTLDDGELKKILDVFNKKLGKMKVYLWSNGQSRVLINNYRLVIIAEYVSDVEFEKGDATILTSLIRKGDKWEILGYKVNSDVFNIN